MGAGLVFNVLVAVGTSAASVAACVLVKVCADDVRDWAPRVSLGLVSLAVRRLPADQRERYREEWVGHVLGTPGTIGKVAVALGLQAAALRMGHGPGWPRLLGLRHLRASYEDWLALKIAFNEAEIAHQQLLLMLEKVKRVHSDISPSSLLGTKLDCDKAKSDD